VKLIVPEAGSRALADFIGPDDELASCALARVEVLRALRRHGTGPVAEARAMLEEMTLLRLDDALLSAASEIDDPRLRAFDAIHVAAAASLGDELETLVTYDGRMLLAAEALALPVASPA
jgi:predicted nucleic acid-binding protein